MPRMHHVDSSSIEAIGYDAGTNKLYVRFLESGETYVYHRVEKWVFDEMLSAASKGTYFSNSIKGRYSYTKL